MRLRKKRTKNLTYNENTKVIEVKKNTENKVQLFLEHNKIYFETIMMLILSFAGIIVSIVGVKVAMVANDISLNEQRIEDLEKQPAFVLDIETDKEKLKYSIKNVGGDIKYGNVFGDVIFIRTVYSTTEPVHLLSGMIRKKRKCSRHFISYAKNIGLGRRKQKMLIGMAV